MTWPLHSLTKRGEIVAAAFSPRVSVFFTSCASTWFPRSGDIMPNAKRPVVCIRAARANQTITANESRQIKQNGELFPARLFIAGVLWRR